MPYGTIKVDTITFTDAGVDKSVTISGLVQNPTFSGNITVTGTVSGNTIQGQTVSGATITGGAAVFTTVTGGVATITSGVFALGSASNPSISFTGDANSGLYSPGADQVAISTGGSGRLFVDASGNVGIGTTSPQASLGFGTSIDTTSTDVSKIQLYNSGGAIYGFGVSANQLNYRAGTAGDAHVWYSGFTERARIDSSGRLLIGTSSDSGGALLQVNDNRIRIATAKSPASATDTGAAGEICWDASYIYVCTATNTWKRTAISTW